MAQRKTVIRNLSRLRKKLRRMDGAVTRGIRIAIVESAEKIEAEMKARAPRDSGDTIASIETRYGRDGFSASTGPGAKTARAQKAAGWRAHFIEFGVQPHKLPNGTQHPGNPAQPFIFPAFEVQKPAAKERIAKAVRKALQDVAKDRTSDD